MSWEWWVLKIAFLGCVGLIGACYYHGMLQARRPRLFIPLTAALNVASGSLNYWADIVWNWSPEWLFLLGLSLKALRVLFIFGMCSAYWRRTLLVYAGTDIFLLAFTLLFGPLTFRGIGALIFGAKQTEIYYEMYSTLNERETPIQVSVISDVNLIVDLIIGLYLIYRWKVGYRLHLPERSLLPLLCLISGTVFFEWVLYFTAFSMFGSASEDMFARVERSNIVTSFVLLFAGTLVLIVYALKHLEDHYRLRGKEEAAAARLKRQTAHYAEAARHHEQLRRLRHDMANMMTTAQRLVREGRLREAEQFLDQYEDRLEPAKDRR